MANRPPNLLLPLAGPSNQSSQHLPNPPSSATHPPTSAGGPAPVESKREKKRREVVERVEREHENKMRWKESTFESLHKELNEKQIALSKDPPVYPALEVPMYLLNLERDALMLQVEMGWESRMETLHHLHALERTKIEEDFRKGRDAVRQRLLDGVEERRRRIREDKESTGDIVAETLLEAQVKPRPSRSTQTSKRNIYGHSPPLSSAGARLTPRPSSDLARTVASADLLLAALIPPSTAHATPLSTDNILSPLPYSLMVMPAPNPPERGGKTARRVGRAPQIYGKDAAGDTNGTNGGAGNNDTAGNGNHLNNNSDVAIMNPTAKPSARASGPNNTVVRVGMVITGYAKVNGWTPGKSIDELRGLVSCTEMERDMDIMNIKGWGRRARGNRGQAHAS